MPTDIYFTGDDVPVRVDEDPSQVADAFSSSQGRPFRLTGHDGGGEVYINPAMVAFWRSPEPSQSEPLEEPQPIQRSTVTDIWGNPLRRKPRR